MGSGCGNSIVENVPSSSGQLPVPVALNAGSPTLFPLTIHEMEGKVKGVAEKFSDRIPGCPGEGNPVGDFPGLSRRFRWFPREKGLTMVSPTTKGGRAMQCQKLKTYMETGRVIFLPAQAIRPNPAQPRKVFDPEGLDELAESIRRHGILQPLSVRRSGSGYELIAGERRWRAAQQAGVTDIPCIIMRMDDKESGLAAMVENLQRRDLDYIEEAMGIEKLLKDWDMSQEQAARLLGKSQSAIANKLRILKHPPAVLDALRQTGLTERHARALLKLGDEQKTLDAIRDIARAGMSVARAEQYIDALLARAESPAHRPNIGLFLNNLTQNLQKIQLSGIPAVSERRETESQIVLTITIPKT